MEKNLLINETENFTKRLRKKAGDDKLVISLVLIAVGVILCFIYRNQINAVITSAIEALSGKINSLFENSQIDGSTTTP